MAYLQQDRGNQIQKRQHVVARPFLKWAGGKTQLLDELAVFVPQNYNKYIEPFLGGGALFFKLNPPRSIISDSNEELINAYQTVKADVENLIDVLVALPYSEDFYYKLRSQKATNLSTLQRAARFIFLNKTCFNGLYRVNKKGEFNVPFGKNKNPSICSPENLRSCSSALKNAFIEHGDYNEILLKYAEKNDFVYMDPPYHPVSRYSDFKRYTKDFFYEKDQIILRDMHFILKERGCYFVSSNSYSDFTLELYKDFSIKTVSAKRQINCLGTRRGNVNEVLIT